jgi:hypothetical protein
MLHTALDLPVRAAGSRLHSFSLLISFEARTPTCDRDEELHAPAFGGGANG